MNLTTLWEIVGSNLFWGLVGSVIGAIVVFFAQDMLARLRERRGFLTGVWEQIIYDDHGITIKRDKVTIRHEGHAFTGYVNRLQPIDQSFRSWHLQGRV